jgi:hypothetical protein
MNPGTSRIRAVWSASFPVPQVSCPSASPVPTASSGVTLITATPFICNILEPTLSKDCTDLERQTLP